MTNTKENILTVKPEDKKMMNSVIWRSMTAMGKTTSIGFPIYNDSSY